MRLNEKERKEKAEELKRAEENALKEAQKREVQRAIDSGKAVEDISAEERFYNRSIKIRRGIMAWLVENEDKSFESLGDLEAQAANMANCSMVTARRWLYQFTRENKPFEIVDKGDFYIIRGRSLSKQ